MTPEERSEYVQYRIKSGKLDRKYGALLSELYDWGQKADYGNVFDFDSESVKPQFNNVLDLIQQVEKVILEGG